MKLSKECRICKKRYFKKVWTSVKNWGLSKYCSQQCLNKSKIGNTYKTGISYPAWNKGIPQTEKVKKILSKKLKVIAKEKGFGLWMKGKKLSIETRKKQSEANKRLVAEGKHNFYIDGRTPINHQIRRSLEYRLWREAVFKRDNWTCQWCKARSGNGKKVYLHADHIKKFSEYPNLRFEISNGRTLCVVCHFRRHTKNK